MYIWHEYVVASTDVRLDAHHMAAVDCLLIRPTLVRVLRVPWNAWISSGVALLPVSCGRRPSYLLMIESDISITISQCRIRIPLVAVAFPRFGHRTPAYEQCQTVPLRRRGS